MPTGLCEKGGETWLKYDEVIAEVMEANSGWRVLCYRCAPTEANEVLTAWWACKLDSEWCGFFEMGRGEAQVALR